MATSLAARTPIVRTRQAALTLWLLVVSVVWMLLLQLVVGSLFPPIGFIQAIIYAVPLFLVWRRIRGGFITAAIVSALVLSLNAGPIVGDLGNPASALPFFWTIGAVVFGIAVIIAAIVAAVQGRRRAA